MGRRSHASLRRSCFVARYGSWVCMWVVLACDVISHACAMCLPTVGMQHRQGGCSKLEAGARACLLVDMMCFADQRMSNNILFPWICFLA